MKCKKKKKNTHLLSTSCSILNISRSGRKFPDWSSPSAAGGREPHQSHCFPQSSIQQNCCGYNAARRNVGCLPHRKSPDEDPRDGRAALTRFFQPGSHGATFLVRLWKDHLGSVLVSLAESRRDVTDHSESPKAQP